MGEGTTGAWTVVNHTADDSPATATAITLVRWLAAQPGVTLHTVLWLPGWTSTEPFRAGRFHDVARDHRWKVPLALRRAGRARLAGRLTGLAAKRTLARVPRQGVLYLNGAASVASLPYLPGGERTVVTHLYAADRLAEPSLAPAQVERLVAATDVWVADDPATRDWAVATWGVDADAFRWAGEVRDLEAWERGMAAVDIGALSVAVSGGTWFRRDHTARLVQALQRLRPGLAIDLLWTEVERDEHLAPLLHDLDVLGVRERLHVPLDHAELHERLREVDVLALTAPDDDAPWLAWEAAKRGLPVVCFASHRRSPAVGDEAEGVVVDYLDITGMAAAVIDLALSEKEEAARSYEERRADVADHDVAVYVGRLASSRSERCS